ncbi:MAG: site-specific integrase [Cytophagales bacterium]|nr:site-specific integrase [Cytophagales bacterium]
MTHLIERFTEHLKSGKYNQQTIVAYRNAIFVFYNLVRDMPQSKITDEFIGAYLKDLTEKKDKSEAMQAGKALKLFYEVIFNRKLGIKSTGDSKEEKLPEILSKEEIKKLLYTVTNVKHKALLLLIYNSGLSISEAINLRVEDLDIENRMISIWDKERVECRRLSLAPNIIDFIKRYFVKEKPTDVLFPGEKGTPYSSRNVQLFFQSALKKAGLEEKNATVHTLRHSYAVHALEAGMDIHILQHILGHKFLQTTSVYNQLAVIDLTKLRNPIADINLLEGELNFSLY